jgi:hypothetical protein
VISVVGDVPVDSEMSVVFRQFREFAGMIFEDAHREVLGSIPDESEFFRI